MRQSRLRNPDAALDASLTGYRRCRRGLDDPDVDEALVALECSCRARMAVWLPPVPDAAHAPRAPVLSGAR